MFWWIPNYSQAMFRKFVDNLLSFSLANNRIMDEENENKSFIYDKKISPSDITPATRINLFQHLDSLARENYSYYKGYAEENPEDATKAAEILPLLDRLRGHIPESDKLAESMSKSVDLFDLSPEIQGNGYRSLLAVVDCCLLRLVELNVYCKDNREVFYFRHGYFVQGLKDYTNILGTLRAVLRYAIRMMEEESRNGKNSLFSSHESQLLEEWLVEVETLDQSVFYGNCTAFHLCGSIRAAMHTITTALATFAERYRELDSVKPGSGPEALSYFRQNLFASRKFILDQNLKAKELVAATRDLDITFCKAFWSIAESRFWQPFLWLMLPKMEVCRDFLIHPETFSLPKVDNPDEQVTVIPPTIHIGERPLPVRLLSAKLREGQLFVDTKDNAETFKMPDKMLTKSDYLIFHLHGGGFVAQSSASCDLYLREWVKELSVPALSVDYTLAPEGPYPRATEEVFYAYCWALKNPHKLGWTGKSIVLAGDSAGGNLVFSIALKAYLEGVRMPDGIMGVYAPFLVQYTPSPSRMMSLMDPLIPIGILTRCLATYAGIPEPTNVGDVQPMENESADSSPSESGASVNSWDRLSASELNGKEQLPSATSSPTSEETRHAEKQKEEKAQEAITAQQRSGFPLRIPSVEHVLSVAHPITSRVSRHLRNVTGVVSRSFTNIRELLESQSAPNRPRAMSIENPSAPWTKMLNPLKRYNFATVPTDDPLLSPLQADDVLLRALPPVRLIASHMDPCLDDSVAMARRLYAVGKQETTKLDILSHLPHGFLNFVLVSKEAKEGNRLTIVRLRELFGIPQP